MSDCVHAINAATLLAEYEVARALKPPLAAVLRGRCMLNAQATFRIASYH